MALYHSFLLPVPALPWMALLISSASQDVVLPGFNFRRSLLCPDQNCVTENRGKTRNRLECAYLCSNATVCAGFSFDTGGNCSFLQDGCFTNLTCPTVVPGIYASKKQPAPVFCQNEGQWDEQRKSCVCINGWVGSRCERQPYKCQELLTFGYNPGMHRVLIDVFKNQSRLVFTQCYINTNTWQTYLFASDGTQSHNRTWTDYVLGYEQGPWNIWLGLENILAFNSMGHAQVALDVVLQPSPSNVVLEIGCKNFSMQDASSGYSFTCSNNFSTTYGYYALPNKYTLRDIISMSQGLPFSTSDMDKDQDSQNCAALFGAGWWLKDCSSGAYINPLGFNPKSLSSPPVLNKMWLPDINTSDVDIMQNFQSVLMIFQD